MSNADTFYAVCLCLELGYTCTELILRENMIYALKQNPRGILLLKLLIVQNHS